MSTRTMTEATLHDGSRIPVSITGDGPAVLLPIRHEPTTRRPPPRSEPGAAIRTSGRRSSRAASRFRVVAADYEGHRMANPAPETLTPDALAADALAIADAAGAEAFAWYGYSWLALTGLQLALRTDRLWALAMGGYPPLDGPYAAMLDVTRAAHALSVAAAAAPPVEPVEVTPGDWDTVQVRTSEAQTQQFVTLYEALATFDDRAALPDAHDPAPRVRR